MPYEVCYRALLSISVVEGLKPHTTHAATPPPRAGPLQPLTAARARRATAFSDFTPRTA